MFYGLRTNKNYLGVIIEYQYAISRALSKWLSHSGKTHLENDFFPGQEKFREFSPSSWKIGKDFKCQGHVKKVDSLQKIYLFCPMGRNVSRKIREKSGNFKVDE